VHPCTRTAFGVTPVPPTASCAAENTSTLFAPLSLTHKFPVLSKSACCGNVKPAPLSVTLGVPQVLRILDRRPLDLRERLDDGHRTKAVRASKKTYALAALAIATSG